MCGGGLTLGPRENCTIPLASPSAEVITFGTPEEAIPLRLLELSELAMPRLSERSLRFTRDMMLSRRFLRIARSSSALRKFSNRSRSMASSWRGKREGGDYMVQFWLKVRILVNACLCDAVIVWQSCIKLDLKCPY